MMFDRDGDGKIGREEFEEIYSKLDPSSEYRDAKKLFDIVDMNKNGVIDFTEWSFVAINQQALLTESKIKAAFRLFDRDNSGTISAEEIAKTLAINSNSIQVWEEII